MHSLYCTRPQSLPGPYAFQGISPSSQGPSPTCLGKSSPRKSQEDRDQGGCGPHLQRPPSLARPSGPFPVLSPAGVAAPNEPRVGPAHPSRQPLAPAASGMLQPPSFSWQRPWLPPPPACHGAPSAWPHPRGEPKVLLYITPGDVSIFIAVLKPHVFYTEPSSPTPPLPTQQKVFKTLRFLGQANRLGLCWLQQWFQPAATGGETTLKKKSLKKIYKTII